MPHLPAGHEPGPQSRRGRFGTVAAGCALPIVLFVGGTFVVVLAVVGLALLSSSVGAYGLIPLAVAVAIGVGVSFLVRMIWRGARPRYDRELVPAVDATETRRGASVRVDLPLPVGAADVEVGLVCRVRYDVQVSTHDSDTGSSTSRRTRIAVHREDWQPATGAGVALAVPRDAPCSYEGDAVSFDWSVRARRRGAKRTSAPVALWVAP